MGIGAIVLSPQRERLLVHSEYVPSVSLNGKTTNNIAEYMALIAILEFMLNSGLHNEEIKCVGDSKLVVEQMSGNWAANKGDYIPYFHKAKELASHFTNISYHWIPREQNTIADDLSKQCMKKNGCEFKIQKY